MQLSNVSGPNARYSSLLAGLFVNLSRRSSSSSVSGRRTRNRVKSVLVSICRRLDVFVKMFSGAKCGRERIMQASALRNSKLSAR